MPRQRSLEIGPLTIPLSEDLLLHIEQEANKRRHSLISEIVRRLQRSREGDTRQEALQQEALHQEGILPYIERAAHKRGHSVTDEIVRRLRSSREVDARQEALQEIASTVQAADSTITAIQQLLTVVKPLQPLAPPPVGTVDHPKGNGKNTSQS
jgi:hypothetical protein